jgi:hypothetical protein
MIYIAFGLFSKRVDVVDLERIRHITVLKRSDGLHSENDPVNHPRTTRQHAGESMTNGTNAPGLAAIAVGVVALVVGLFALATGHPGVSGIAVTFAAVAVVVGAIWLALTHRRVRKAELDWAKTNSEEPVPPPSS